MTTESLNPLSEPPLPALPKDQRKVLIVFIHGFLGSEESFFNFPEHLVEVLQTRHGLPHDKVETRMFPRYDTRGHNARSVQKLIDWLLIYATTGRYECVILMAHSMGGLLAADAYQYMYALHKEKVEERLGDPEEEATADGREEATTESKQLQGSATVPSSAPQASSMSALTSWFGSWTIGGKKGSGNTVSSSKSDCNGPLNDLKKGVDTDGFEGTDEHSPDSDVRVLVNIRGIITFDSPFYGLHTNVITQAGTNKAIALVSEGLYNPKAYLPAAMEAVSTYAPRTIDLPTGSRWVGSVPIPTSWVVQAAQRVVGTQTQVLPTPTETVQVERKEIAYFTTTQAASSNLTEHPIIIHASDVTTTCTTATVDITSAPSDQAIVSEKITSESIVEVSATPTSSRMPGWVRYAVGAAAVGAGAYATLAVAPLAAAYVPTSLIAGAVVGQFAVASAEQIRDHLHFLYPLVNSHSDMHQRIQMLRREMELRKRLTFKGFFLALPPLSSSPSSAATLSPNTEPVTKTAARSSVNELMSTPSPYSMSQAQKDLLSTPTPYADSSDSRPTPTSTSSPSPPKPLPSELSPEAGKPTPNSNSTACRHFCNPPPAETAHLFEPVTHPLPNEIDAHMHIFDSTVGWDWYMDLVCRTADAVNVVINRESERGKDGVLHESA